MPDHSAHMQGGWFVLDELMKLGSAHKWVATPGLGSLVQLNSGSPPLMIVDHDATGVTVAWRDGVKIQERKLPLIILKPHSI